MYSAPSEISLWESEKYVSICVTMYGFIVGTGRVSFYATHWTYVCASCLSDYISMWYVCICSTTLYIFLLAVIYWLYGTYLYIQCISILFKCMRTHNPFLKRDLGKEISVIKAIKEALYCKKKKGLPYLYYAVLYLLVIIYMFIYYKIC